MAAMCSDLEAETAEVVSIVAPLTEAGWDTPTPAEGWNIRDQLGHLAFFDEKALLALSDPNAFTSELNAVAESGDLTALENEHLARGRSMTGAAVLAWWKRARLDLVDAYATLDPGTRVVWYGPAMSVRSKITARIMETWAHGQDVRDALGVVEIPTGRLRHVCHIAVGARSYAFIANGVAPPEVDVRVELSTPTGEVWTWGSEDAVDRVTGPALDFALLATQRRHRVDLTLSAVGVTANKWLDVAQAFAGPPGSGREPGQFG
jgi:uncharacterized protein (TIGR03084 family)